MGLNRQGNKTIIQKENFIKSLNNGKDLLDTSKGGSL